MERAGEQGCGRDATVAGDGGPEGLLLYGVEDEPVVGGVFEPDGVDEAVKVEDLRSEPGGEAFALTGAIEVGSDGSGGSLAGGNDEATAGEPCVDICVGFYFSDSCSARPVQRCVEQTPFKRYTLAG
jgi:hypothetical protein